jgi:hypothetical protein
MRYFLIISDFSSFFFIFCRVLNPSLSFSGSAVEVVCAFGGMGA